mmetsp:Transcript_49198/g.157567  ORF Transcript_49198/g.157567 Transcript_49198/m.157567 type:complete len:254 (-) Transcript_49198:6-767(-)
MVFRISPLEGLVEDASSVDYLAAFITLMGCVTWLKLMDLIVALKMMESKLSRKVIHITTGPFYMGTWFLYSHDWSARWFAVLTPFLISLQFVAIALGYIKDPRAVRAMTRTGDPKEMLLGPLFYGMMFCAVTLVGWRHAPPGIVALSSLCGGDGLADIVGRRLGHRTGPLPWNRGKTWAGTLACFVGSVALAAPLLWAFNDGGHLEVPLSGGQQWACVLAGSLVGTAAESSPVPELDNIFIVLAASAGCNAVL